MSSAKRELGCSASRSDSSTNGRAAGVANPVCVALDCSQPQLILPFDLAVFQRRPGRCHGSRWGRLAPPLTTPWPERPSSQVKWRVLPPRLAMSCRLAGFGEVASSPRFHSHSQSSPGVGLGACWCPGRSGAAIYPTVSGGACSATTTSHDFAVTGTEVRTAISLGLAVRYLKVKARVSACSPFWLATMTL